MTLYGYINGMKNDTFEITKQGTTKKFYEGEFVVIYYLFIDCTLSYPCRLTIIGEE